MNDFYCPYCEHGMNKEDTHIHEDDVLGEWEVECPECKKNFRAYSRTRHSLFNYRGV